MKTTSIIAVLTLIALTSAADAAVTVQSGWNSEAVNYGGLRLRNLRLSGNGGEVYLGEDPGGTTKVENEFGYGDQWGFDDQEVNTFELSYAVNTHTLSSKVTTASGDPLEWTLNYAIDPAEPLNYIQMTLSAKTSGTSLSVTNLTFNSEDLGDYLNVSGYNDWSLYGDFNQDFTLTGDLTLYGASSNAENNKVQFMVGNVPEPATLSLLALGGLALIRRKRK